MINKLEFDKTDKTVYDSLSNKTIRNCIGGKLSDRLYNAF